MRFLVMGAGAIGAYVAAHLAKEHEVLVGVRSRASAGNEGHGLGLAIVARILRAHRGRAEARLRPGGGLEVSLRWPNQAQAV